MAVQRRAATRRLLARRDRRHRRRRQEHVRRRAGPSAPRRRRHGDPLDHRLVPQPTLGALDAVERPRPTASTSTRTTCTTLRRVLLDPLSATPPQPYRAAAFDEPSDSPVDAAEEHADAGSVLLFDGLFLQRPELRPYWDLVVWLDGQAPRRPPPPRLGEHGVPAGRRRAPPPRRPLGAARPLPPRDAPLPRGVRPDHRADVVVANDDLAAPASSAVRSGSARPVVEQPRDRSSAVDAGGQGAEGRSPAGPRGPCARRAATPRTPPPRRRGRAGRPAGRRTSRPTCRSAGRRSGPRRRATRRTAGCCGPAARGRAGSAPCAGGGRRPPPAARR